MTNATRHKSTGAGASRHRRGAVLILAIIVSVALATIALTLGRSIRVEAAVAANRAAAHQAEGIARGAEQHVLAIVADAVHPLADAEEEFDQPIALGQGWYWVLRPDSEQPESWTGGIVDESAKVNVNTADLDTLRRLPEMTEQMAASLIDWRDGDDQVTPGGGESEIYERRPSPYRAKNAPLESVEELLWIQGFSREAVYGSPAAASSSTSGMDTRLSVTRIGHAYLLASLLTVWSQESNLDPNGDPRVNPNIQTQRPRLRERLREVLGQDRGNAVGARLPNRRIEDLFDLGLTTGMSAAELALIEPYVSFATGGVIRGRINVNAAPRDVLLSLPNLTGSDVDSLLARRPSANAANATSVAWVLEVLRERAIGLGNRITGGGSRYSAEIVAVAGNGRAFRRVRLLIDRTTATPRIVYRRDVTLEGWPLAESILTSLRAGRGLSGDAPLAKTWN